MLAPTRRLAKRLHNDESAPNTVEWVLLIIVGLIVLLAIFIAAQWILGQFETRQGEVQNDAFMQR